nr:hypothetical protein GCM10020063_035880 [Dactylosporangium thailandense]
MDHSQAPPLAVGARQTFFVTAGISLSVKTAILAVASGPGRLPRSRDAHRPIAGIVDSLHPGPAAGRAVPDAAGTRLDTVRVAA